MQICVSKRQRALENSRFSIQTTEQPEPVQGNTLLSTDKAIPTPAANVGWGEEECLTALQGRGRKRRVTQLSFF